MHVGQAVVVAAGFKERGEGLGIARQGAVGGQAHAVLHGFEGAIQPDGDAVVFQQVAIGGLAEGAAAEGHHGRRARVPPSLRGGG